MFFFFIQSLRQFILCVYLQNHKKRTFYALKVLKPANQRFKVNLQQIYYMSIPEVKT